MKWPVKQKIVVLSVVILITGLLQIAFTWSQYGDDSYAGQGAIKGDGRGYYDYLTSIFIDHDLDQQAANGRTIVASEGRPVNKYYSGTALLMLPFFLIAFVVTSITNDSINGLELPFQISMGISALFYLLAGLLFVFKILSLYKVQPLVQSLMVIVLALGTNMLYYTSQEVTNAHVYSFFTIAAFSFFTMRYFLDPNFNDLLWASLFFGLTVLIRPVDGLILFSVPFLSGSIKGLRSGLNYLLNNAGRSILCVVLIIGIAGIQLLLYKIQTGYWLVWSYTHEGFYFSNPAFFEFLVGFKRGWIVYSPLFLLLIPGLIVLYKKDAFSFWNYSLFFLLTVYVLSAWWSWHYGGSFGSRPMIDFYAIIIIPISLLVNVLDTNIKRVFAYAFLVFCMVLNAFQSYQAYAQILPMWNMDSARYIWVFGKIGSEHTSQLGGRNDIMPYHRSSQIIYSGNWNGANDGHWNVHHVDQSEEAMAFILNEEVEYNGVYKYRFSESVNDRIFIEYQLERIEFTQNAATESYIVIDVKDSLDRRKHYDAFRINDRPDLEINQWKEWKYSYDLAVPIEKNDRLTIYLWNKGLGRFNVRNPSITLKRML